MLELPPRDSLLPRTALILSGGGARGISQIGILKGLQLSGLRIDYIIGTSIGAIVGGMYSSGITPNEMADILNSDDWKSAVAISNRKIRNQLFFDQKEQYDRSLISLKFKDFVIDIPDAVTEGKEFDKFLQKIIWRGTYQPEINFDKLKIPFRAIATDLVSGKSVSLSGGNISKAIRASATIPLRYTPIKLDSMILVDGGILNNLPVSHADEFNPELIIAVNTTSPLHKSENLNSAIVIADQVISIAMDAFTNANKKNADFIITPNLGYYPNDDFNNVDSLIKIGYDSFIEVKGKLIELIADRINQKILSIIKTNNLEINNENYDVVFTGFDTNHTEYLKELYPGIKSKNDIARLILSLYLLDNEFYSGFKIYKKENKLFVMARAYPEIKLVNIDLPKNLQYQILQLTDNFLMKPFSPNVQRELFESILRYLHIVGYSFANISSVREWNGSVSINCNLGRIDSVIYKLPNKLKEFLVARELTFEKGEFASSDKFIESIENLNSTMIFKNVEIIPEKNSKGGIDVVVSVEEEPNQVIKLGGRVDNERNAQAGLDFIMDNFNFIGTRIVFRNVLSSSYFKSGISFENTKIFRTNLSSSLSFYYKDRKMYEYFPRLDNSQNRFGNLRAFNFNEERYGVKSLFGTQLEKNGRLFAEIRHEYQRFSRVSDTIRRDFESFTTLKFGLLIDNQDRVDFPKQGRYIDLSLESSIFTFNRTDGFSKATFIIHNNWSFGDLTLRPSLMFGIADATLPFLEFFNLGGEGSFFGLREEEERGRQIFKAGLNYSYQLPIDFFFDTYIFGRYDVGAIWLLPEEIKISNLRHGFGTGLAFDTPLGPARFSVGKSWYFLENPNSVKWGPTELYFVIGINL